MSKTRTRIIIGGGAAGFFTAIHSKVADPSKEVIILEKSAEVLEKVRISGGGRCNVTHACFDHRDLAAHYPRGQKELLGVFTRFQPGDTMDWFESRGIPLKIESDGRVFPQSDSSQSIIDCLLNEAKGVGVRILTKRRVVDVSVREGHFHVRLSDGMMTSDELVLATGGSRTGHEFAKRLGHTLVDPVPSLFTFTIKDPALRQLSGLSCESATVTLEGMPYSKTGPVLVTHWGLSGPAIITLSSWAARDMAALGYTATVYVDWLAHVDQEACEEALLAYRDAHLLKQVGTQSPFSEFAARLWRYLCARAGLDEKTPWKALSTKHIQSLAAHLKHMSFHVTGKSAFKDEFVTAGGVSNKEIDFRTMQSKSCPHLYVVGEALDIDGVTGGFNFQNAWSTGVIAGLNSSKS